MTQQAIGVIILASLSRAARAGDLAAGPHKAYSIVTKPTVVLYSVTAKHDPSDVTGIALDQRTYLRAVTSTLNVAVPLALLFPMARYQTLLNVGYTDQC